MSGQATGVRGTAPAPDLQVPRSRPRLLVALVVIGAVLVGGVAIAYGVLRPTVYEAEALLVVTSDNQTADAAIPIASVWAAAGNSTSVQRAAAARVRAPRQQLSASTTVGTVESTPVVSVAVRRKSPEEAQTWANGVATTIAQQSAREPVAGFEVSLVTSAVASASQRSSPLILGVGGSMLGALVGLACYVLWSRRLMTVA